MAKAAPIAIALVSLAAASTAQAQFGGAAAGRDTLPQTYAAAMKCFVANTRAIGVKRRAGDAAGVARYEAGQRASYEAARVVATTLGYSDHQLDADFKRSRERELPKMLNDQTYFGEAVATCRALGLMPLP